MASSETRLIDMVMDYFKNGYQYRDYATLWNERLYEYILNNSAVLFEGPKDKHNQEDYKAILLDENKAKEAYLWFAPAGNIPDTPKMVVVGRATSIPALQYFMGQINMNNKLVDDTEIVRKALIESCYRGSMLGNLAVALRYLKIDSFEELDIDLYKEWSNINNANLARALEPEGHLFTNPKKSEIMFTQWCMHCGATFSKKTGLYNTNSNNIRSYLELNERNFPSLSYRLIREKFFQCIEAKLLIALGYEQYKIIRDLFCAESEYKDVVWLDINKMSPNEFNLHKSRRYVTWIPHPSPGNLFYNPTNKKKGILSQLFLCEDDTNNKTQEEICKVACEDYPRLIKQVKQLVALKNFFNR